MSDYIFMRVSDSTNVFPTNAVRPHVAYPEATGR